MPSQRRTTLALLGASLLLPALGLAPSAHAQAGREEIITAPKILDALNPKDIVLDRPGAMPSAQRPSTVSLSVQFTFGSAELLPQGKRQLDQLALALSDQALLADRFELVGHTDAVGDAESNLRLSLERAEAVKAYLQEVHGFAAQRLLTLGLGFTRLADPARPTAAVNRRVEVRRLRASAASPVGIASPGGRLVPTPQ